MLSSFLLILLVILQVSCENDTVVFQRGEAGYYCVRIPSVLTTAKGSLLAFGEGRKGSCADNTEKDIVYTNEVLTMGKHVGNFVPVQLKYNQRILIPFCKNNIILMQSYSDDDGLTFSSPQVIYNVTKPEWNQVDLGLPSGLLLQSNRIVIPGYYLTKSSSGGYFSTGFVMLNDFNGEIDKWYLGGQYSLDKYYPNEAEAVELLSSPNSIFIKARSSDTVRVGAYSNDGGITFNKVKLINNLVEPIHGCEGSTLYHSSTHQLFYSGIAETTMRTNLSLYVSVDNGESWKYLKTIWSRPSAYSSLTELSDQSIGILFEGGTVVDYDSLLFTIAYNATELK